MPSNSSASPDTMFTPRREFLREQKQTNSFSLLALAGSNCIRLYSFPLPVIVHLRRFLDQGSVIAGYREDVTNNLCEFALNGKPWNSPKSVASERLLIEILAILYLHGYTYLSTIDYGREHDDRLVMTFSKPSGRVESPPPTSPNHSKTSFSEQPKSKPKPKRAPFALSFPSTTMLRVVCPPLDSTPAILQAVRGSWPRGVVSEKKVGDNTFEFKLKGYRWFQQDTFAVDSLRHILSLLSSLDTHSFTLLASLSLSNRSRVKDLWLFTSPASAEDIAFPDSPAPSASASQTEFKRVQSPDLPPYHPIAPIAGSHRRFATDPVPVNQSPLQHVRAATETPMRNAAPASPSPTQTHTLRKPAPRAQVPVSVHDDSGDAQESYRVQLPSKVPSDVENMTGVGAAQRDILYATLPFHANASEASNAVRSATPKSSGSGPSTPMDKASTEIAVVDRSMPSSETHTPPLLGPGVFRDSAFSTNSDMSSDIPIKWTGLGVDTLQEEQEPPPDFPGGWQPTPTEEPAELDIKLDQRNEPEEPIQEVIERVASPALSDPNIPRKSAAGLVGVMASDDAKGKEKEIKGGGQGWVLVNVEGSAPPEEANDSIPSAQNRSDPLSSSSPKSSSSAVGDDIAAQRKSPKASMSPAAKAIVIVDAVDSTQRKAKEQVESPSRMRRFFSLTRKDSTKLPDLIDDKSQKAKTKGKSPSNSDKLKNMGTPEASRIKDRRSIDG